MTRTEINKLCQEESHERDIREAYEFLYDEALTDDDLDLYIESRRHQFMSEWNEYIEEQM